jgi:plasmid stabilization system protein ParE
VAFHPEAVEEAIAAERWYRERSESAASAFVAELDRAVELIGEGPHRWPRHVHGTRRYVMHRFPFVVVYRVAADEIQVVAVAHGRRRPDYWQRR